MTNFLFQNIIIVSMYNKNLQNYINDIYYSNYKILLLSKKYINSTCSIIKPAVIKDSINNTILNYCKDVSPNSIIVFSNNINHIDLNKINAHFLKYKGRFMKEDAFWACKNTVLLDILKQKSYEEIKNLNILSCVKDVVNRKNKNKQKIRCEYTEPVLHVVMATYMRNNYLPKIFDMLTRQTYKNFCLHLIDNNSDKSLQKGIDNMINKYSRKINIKLHRNYCNKHCISRLLYIRELLDTEYLEYVIIFDDDQIHYKNWFERMIKECKPLSTLSWYGKIFEKSGDYWNRYSDKNNILTYTDIELHAKPDIKVFKYFGPGGCIFDANLFLLNELYNYERYSDLIYKLDDLWLSFMFDKYLHIPFYRIMYHPKECLDRKDPKNSTWYRCINDKSELMKMLCEKYSWNIIEKNQKIYTLNNVFTRVYVLFSNYKNVEYINNLLINMNVSACFVYYQDQKSTINNICKKNENNTILLLNENSRFNAFFNDTFHDYIANIINSNKRWSVMNFNGLGIAFNKYSVNKNHSLNFS